jgi:hypothetical protein
MFRSSLIALLLLAALGPIEAHAIEPASTCRDAGIAAERNWSLPPDLIQAIGRVESGRFDKATGRVSAWPWTVNADGNGLWFASRAEAIAFVRELQSRGVRLIDVGCFQVDLWYHPTAFSNLEQAFDPDTNANYAAHFLTELRGRTGSWSAAVAGYHSGQMLEGENYRRKILAQWGSGAAFEGVPILPADTGANRRATTPDRFVVLMSAAARAIPVIRP